MKIFYPKLITTMKTYTKEQFIKDLIAGFIVSIIALPLSIALAIASGVSPEKGLYTAIIAGFFISLLGGSRVQIGGPTGAFMIIVYGIVSKYGVDGIIVATFIAGILIILMGLFKLGSVIKYIPYPVTSGFTTGIAVTIFVSQIKDFLGLRIDAKMPAEFVEKIKVLFEYIYTFNRYSILIGILSLLILFYWPRVNKKVPAALIVLIISSAITYIFKLDIATIGTSFSNLNASFPLPKIPNINFDIISKMFMPAVAIAILGSIESLLSAVVADGMIQAKHRSNTELIAQGIANIFSSIFGGIPATGAIARTVANINNGARTPVAGIMHAIFLLVIVLIFFPLAKLIPLSALSAILMMVAINMGEWKELKEIKKSPKSDAFVLVTVFILTVVFDLIIAIEIGMILASFLFMKRMADLTDIKISSLDYSEEYVENKNKVDNIDFRKTGVYVYEINGPFFFGASYKFVETIYNINSDTKAIIIKMTNVNSVDSTAISAIKRMITICNEKQIKLVFCELNSQVKNTFDKTGLSLEKVYDSFIEAKKSIDF
ncbi:SulP family inorganic anion transporter [Oceanivirga miroungae]|uniref:C4-dicarboxylic acid transporter DauA n=1 Tax=Oceanivirga miroungae TaxID=1130046 RepID=A0A6I8MCI3_9FUSO|nr:SulP family inorganic anion transporter [Oceanivirga miroungae]VWL85182.1 C4-dicarboxylic acid transporter DauA [Oceanivirga miroungae]